MRAFYTGLLTVLGSAMLILALLILSIEMFALNQDFFNSEYEELGTAKSIGMNDEDLQAVTENLLKYTWGERDSLDMKAIINGQQREVFDEREKEHMADVKVLYLSARNVRSICIAGAAVMFIAAFIISRRKALGLLCRSFLQVSGVFIVLIAVLSVYAAIDFSDFWTSFHHIFFRNDLWQLDPETEVLINMVPAKFFSDLIIRIVIRFVSIFATLNVAAFIGLNIEKKHGRIKEAKEV